MTDAAPTDAVAMTVSFAGATLPAGIEREIVAEIRVPPSAVVVADPAPAGMVGASIEIDSIDGVYVLGPCAPPPHEVFLRDDGASVGLYRWSFTLRRRVRQTGAAGERLAVDGRPVVTLTGRVRWQVHTADGAHPPESKEFRFKVPVVGELSPDAAGGARRLALRSR